MSKDVYIVDGIRTPIGNFCGTLSSIRTDDLAAHATNYLTFNVRGSNGTTAIVTARTTDSGASGTILTGKVPEELALINADKQVFSDGGYIKLEVDKGGAPTNNKVVFGIKLALARD